MKRLDKEYLIHEEPLRALTIFAVPMIIGNFFQQFYTMVDSMVVGRYVSESALAAVGAAYSLTNVFICVAIGGGVGASVIVSQYFGARKYSKLHQAVCTALISFLVLSVTLGIIGLAAGKQIMLFLKTPEDILDMSALYLRIYFLGLPFLFLYNVLSSMFNALGRSRIPLGLLIFSSVLNIVLDIYMVTVLHLGVAGVAWATLIAQGVSAVISFFIFLRILHGFTDSSAQERLPLFDTRELAAMSRIAFPSILQQSTVSIGMMLVQSVVNSFGTQMLAGYSAAMRVESLCIVPMSGVANAVSSYTAQNIGARQFDRVPEGRKKGFVLVLFFAAVWCILLELFHPQLVRLFLGSDGTPLALATGGDCMRFMGWFYALIGFKMVSDSTLRGSGDMKMFTIANLANLTLRVIIAVTLAPRFGIAFVWYAVPVGWLVNYLISSAEYRTGKWRRLHESA